MAGNDDHKPRRLLEFKDGCRYGKFGRTKAYELIAQERIRAYKIGGKSLIDLDSIDEYRASLPRVESRAMICAAVRQRPCAGMGELGLHHIAVECAFFVKQGRGGGAEAVRAVVAAGTGIVAHG
jgi:excisionase family DNA binding protein